MSGTMSAIADFCRRKITEPGGTFAKDNRIKPPQRDNKNKRRYVLVYLDTTKRGSAVFITQKDIRSIQLGKAALRTGIDFLQKAAAYKMPKNYYYRSVWNVYTSRRYASLRDDSSNIPRPG